MDDWIIITQTYHSGLSNAAVSISAKSMDACIKKLFHCRYVQAENLGPIAMTEIACTQSSFDKKFGGGWLFKCKSTVLQQITLFLKEIMLFNGSFKKKKENYIHLCVNLLIDKK